jgi:hypothetical protein
VCVCVCVCARARALARLCRRTDAMKEVEAIKVMLVDVGNQLEEFEKSLKKYDNTIGHWQAKIAELQDKYIQNLVPVNTHKATAAAAGGGGGGGGAAADDSEARQQQQQQEQQEKQDPPTLELLSEAELKHFNKEDVQYKINMAEQERDALREKVDLSAITEYYAKDAE